MFCYAQALPHIANVVGISVKLHQKFYLQSKTIAYLQEIIHPKVRVEKLWSLYATYCLHPLNIFSLAIALCFKALHML